MKRDFVVEKIPLKRIRSLQDDALKPRKLPKGFMKKKEAEVNKTEPKKPLLDAREKTGNKDDYTKGDPADHGSSMGNGPIGVIERARGVLGGRASKHSGGFWLDGRAVGVGELIRAANEVLRARGEKLLGKDHGRWGQ